MTDPSDFSISAPSHMPADRWVARQLISLYPPSHAWILLHLIEDFGYDTASATALLQEVLAASPSTRTTPEKKDENDT